MLWGLQQKRLKVAVEIDGDTAREPGLNGDSPSRASPWGVATSAVAALGFSASAEGDAMRKLRPIDASLTPSVVTTTVD